MPEHNVASWERVASATAGSALIAFGLARRTWPGSLVALVAGAPLLQRGVTGQCAVYSALDINTATPESDQSGGVTGSVIQVEESITLKRPVAEVFRYWSDFENLPQFMDHLESVKVHQNGCSHWVAKAPLGTTVEWDADIVDFQANELIRWRSRPGTLVPNEGVVQFSSAGEGETILSVRLDYHPPAGALGATVARWFGEEPSVQVKNDLQRFKQIMESDEVPLGTSPRPPAPPAAPAPHSEQNEENVVGEYKQKLKQEAREHKAETLEQTDEAVDLSFPASDPPAW